MPRVRRTEQERRDLVVRQGELRALGHHPSWPVLEAVVEERSDQFQHEAAHALIALGMTAERQAFIRGFLKGMRYVLAAPHGAEARLEDYLKREEAS